MTYLLQQRPLPARTAVHMPLVRLGDLVRKPHHVPARLGLPLAPLAAHLCDPVEADRVLGHAVGDALRVDQERLGAQVVDGVARLVVVWVERDAGLAAEERGLFHRLEFLGASEQPARGDPVLQECGVVGAAREDGGHRGHALVLEEVLKVLLDRVRPRGPREVERAAVPVVDAQHVVGRGDHVEVEVGADLCDLGGGAPERAVDALEVVVGTEEPEFLGRPEAEADGVLDLVLGEGFGDGEDADGARAVVVDAGAGEDRVGVAAEDEDVGLVARFGLGDDVVRGAVFGDGVDVEGGGDGAVGEEREERAAGFLGDANGGCVVAYAAERAGKVAGDVVVDYGPDGAGGFREAGFLAKGTGASLNEGDVSRDFSGIVRCVAANIGDFD